MLTDTHCHLDLEKFSGDQADVLRRAEEAGLTRILVPGINVTSSRAAVKLAESYSMLYAAVGVHPTEAETWKENTSSELQLLAGSHSLFPSPNGRGGRGKGKIVAIGEIGLDYYWDSAPHGLQREVLKKQLALAGEFQLPVILHCREKGDAPEGDCARDLLEELEEWATSLKSSKNPLAERPGVLHSFSGSIETAQQAIALGFYIGVTGPVTYRKERQELIANLQLEQLLLETDSPFLAPHPLRGKRRVFTK